MLCPPDVLSIAKTNENFRLLYDAKGRFRLHSIKDEEAKVSVLFFWFGISKHVTTNTMFKFQSQPIVKWEFV